MSYSSDRLYEGKWRYEDIQKTVLISNFLLIKKLKSNIKLSLSISIKNKTLWDKYYTHWFVAGWWI